MPHDVKMHYFILDVLCRGASIYVTHLITSCELRRCASVATFARGRDSSPSYYDRGYPNHFFAVILNDNFDMSYNSEIFNFDYGEEFWDVELMRSVETEMTEKGFEFKLYGIEDNFEGIWTGSELKK